MTAFNTVGDLFRYLNEEGLKTVAPVESKIHGRCRCPFCFRLFKPKTVFLRAILRNVFVSLPKEKRSGPGRPPGERAFFEVVGIDLHEDRSAVTFTVEASLK